VQTAEQYAVSIVEKYRVDVDPDAPVHRAVDEVTPLLKQWGKQYLAGITLSGAYSKNTAISLSSHVDVLVALDPIPGKEMKNVFWKLFEYLSDQNLRPHTRDVSIRLEVRDFKVDLIPAYRSRGTSDNVLFNKRSGDAVQTDIGQHVHLIANSGRQQEICAFKIWRERNSLEFPSLYLELTVLHALQGERFGRLADNVLAVLRYIAARFEQATVRDPVNGDNVVSNDLSSSEKKAIAKTARDAIYNENWKKIIW